MLRITSKVVAFLVVGGFLFRLGSLVSLGYAAIIHGCVIGTGATYFWRLAGRAKAKMLLEDMRFAVVLSAVIGAPTYLGMTSLAAWLTRTDPHPIETRLATMGILTMTVLAAMTVATLFLCTTSLSSMIMRLRLPMKARIGLSLLFTYFPQMIDAARADNLGLSSLDWPAESPSNLSDRILRQARISLIRPVVLMRAQLSKLVTTDAMQVYYTVAERIGDIQ